LTVEARSQKLRALVIDDEPLARSSVLALLRQDPSIEVIGECNSGLEALEVIPRTRPDLLFLDVQMPECDGFEVLERMHTDSSPAVIFVTAYDQYALRAFEAGALDYLLKPFDNDRFFLALERVKQKVITGRRDPKPERFVIKATGQVLFVKISDVDWIEAADYYCCLHVGPKTHLLRRSMSELEQELDHNVFCRIHRSSIVNLERVEGLRLNPDGEYEVLLENGVRLRISRSYRKQLQTKMGVRDVG
jgi:two-component system, LytTR family, response regulator